MNFLLVLAGVAGASIAVGVLIGVVLDLIDGLQ